MKVTDNILVRRMVEADLPDVFAAAALPPHPQGREDIEALIADGCRGIVAEWYGDFAGFAFFNVTPGEIDLIEFSVCPCDAYLDLCGRMLGFLKDALTSERTSIVCRIYRRDRHSARIFRRNGFAVSGVRRAEDSFLYRYTLDGSMT